MTEIKQEVDIGSNNRKMECNACLTPRKGKVISIPRVGVLRHHYRRVA
jgi:hypothetical protein